MSNKISEILSRSKAIMEKAEQEYGSTSNTNGSYMSESYEEKELPNLTENFIKNNSGSNNRSVAPQNGRYRNIEKSKMPDFIKKAMLETPIDIPESPYPTFDLEDVPELVNESARNKERQSIPQHQTNPTINENIIRKIVKEEMEGVVRKVIEEYLDKSLVTEDIQIKVGGTTFSGTLKPLPRRNK